MEYEAESALDQLLSKLATQYEAFPSIWLRHVRSYATNIIKEHGFDFEDPQQSVETNTTWPLHHLRI